MKKSELPVRLFLEFDKGEIETLPSVKIGDTEYKVQIRPVIAPGIAEGILGWLELWQPMVENRMVSVEFHITRDGCVSQKLPGQCTDLVYVSFYQPLDFYGKGLLLSQENHKLILSNEKCQWGLIAFKGAACSFNISLEEG